MHKEFLKEESEDSRKKKDNFRNFEREFYNNTDSAYEENQFNKKTSTKRHERIAGGRFACKRGH